MQHFYKYPAALKRIKILRPIQTQKPHRDPSQGDLTSHCHLQGLREAGGLVQVIQPVRGLDTEQGLSAQNTLHTSTVPGSREPHICRSATLWDKKLDTRP